MRSRPFLALLLSAGLAVGLTAIHSNMAMAQNLFAPVVTVDETAITQFEINQRALLLQVFRTPGNHLQLAREQLIEDRLKMGEMRRAGLSLPEEAKRRAMEDFAGRANLTLDQFLTLLEQNGVEEETFRDFVVVGFTWRDYIRSRYRGRVQITEAEIDAALGAAGGSGSQIEVLLSEIIIAAPPPRANAAMATAQRISQYTSTSSFEAAARQHSALPSRGQGGRLPWLPLSNYPAAIRAILLDLAPGEVTAPLPITNGVALFQMRAVREAPQPIPESAAIEYAAFYIPGGLSDAGLAEAAKINDRVDSCDDLYGVARGLPAEQLDRVTLPPAEIDQDIALELARLDTGETSFALTRNDGQTLVFLMMCGRTPQLDAEIDREAVRTRLLSTRLAGYADALLADLRADATIRDVN